MQLVFGAKASPLVILRIYPTLATSLVDVSEFIVQVMKTMAEHPELLGESPTFFPRLYHTYHFAFRSVSVYTRVHQLLGPSQVSFLTRLAKGWRGVFLPLCTSHRLGCHRRRPIRSLGLGEDYLLQRYLSQPS